MISFFSESRDGLQAMGGGPILADKWGIDTVI
jgi:hypothetical protein